MPTKAHDSDAGFDCYPRFEDEPHRWEYRVGSHAPRRVPLGFKAAIPDGWYAQLREKSGLAAVGLHVMGGVIDSGFRGEWEAIVVFYSRIPNVDFYISPQKAICQFTLHRVPHVTLTPVDSLPASERGEGGFGSTAAK